MLSHAIRSEVMRFDIETTEQKREMNSEPSENHFIVMLDADWRIDMNETGRQHPTVMFDEFVTDRRLTDMCNFQAGANRSIKCRFTQQYDFTTFNLQ
jgi:hypothetical protein